MLAVLMTLSAVSLTFVLDRAESEPREEQIALMLASVANLTRVALLASAPEKRTDLLAELANKEGINIYVAEDDEKPSPLPPDSAVARIEKKLQAHLGPDTQLTLERSGDQAIYLRTQIAGDAYWIALPLNRLGAKNIWQWLGWGGLVTAIALIAAAWFVSRLSRPLRDLSRAAKVIGAGQHPPPLTESGPDELVTVAHAFNQMNTDLAAIDQDRALILAGISHDLRTPLTRLRMGIEMAVGSDDMRDSMSSDIEEMDRTIGQFLDFARDESGESEENTDLLQLLGDIQTSYVRRGFHVVLDSDSELKPQETVLTVHAKTLRRAITNLIDNAIRYGGEHCPEKPITLSLSKKQRQFCIGVADRGPGIPADKIDYLKRPFTRLEAARSNTTGSGLGLAIVERIARQHGGQMELLPRVGGGLLACIELPLR